MPASTSSQSPVAESQSVNAEVPGDAAESGLRKRRGLGAPWAVGALLLIQLLLLLPTLDIPPLGRDAWRETDGLIVARNFCREGGPLWLPRVDARGNGPGITGMEFPLLNRVGGHLMCAGLPLLPSTRAITLLSLLIATVCVFLLATRVWSRPGALLATAAFGFSPASLYYGRTVQPDMAALALALLALLLFESALRRGRPEPRRAIMSAVCMGLGCLIKLPVIVFGLPLLVRVVQELGLRRGLRTPVLWAYALIALGPALAWYSHARGLQALHGLHTFNLGQPLSQLGQQLMEARFYRLIFVTHLWESYAFPLISGLAVLAGVLCARRLPTLAWTVALAALSGLFLAGYAGAHHIYYGLPLVAGLALLSPALLERLNGRAHLLAVTGLMLGALTYGALRIQVWFPDPEQEARHLRLRAAVDAVATPDERVVLFSGGDPTLLWFTDRKGWVLGTAPKGWAFPARVVMMDVRRMGPEEAVVLPLLADQGFKPRFEEGTLRMWHRPTR